MSHASPTSPGLLMTRKSIEEYLKVSRARVHQLTAATNTVGFPDPVDDPGGHPVWERTAVEEWKASRPAGVGIIRTGS